MYGTVPNASVTVALFQYALSSNWSDRLSGRSRQRRINAGPEDAVIYCRDTGRI